MAAVLYILFSVLVWSFLPLFGAIVLEKVNLWDFLLWTQLIGVVFSGMLLQKQTQSDKEAYQKLKSLGAEMHDGFALTGLTYVLSLGCMWAAFSYISKAGATIIYEMWPLFSMFMTPIFLQKAWPRLPARNFIYIICALAGVAFILSPELKAPFFAQAGSPLKAWFTLLLPLFGGIFMSISSVFKARLSHRMETPDNMIISKLTVQTYCMMYGLIFAAVFSVIVRIAGGGTHNTYDTPTIFLIAFIGVVIYVLGSLSYVVGLLKSSRPSIIALWYLTPVLSILWLFMAGLAVLTPTIIIGTVAIISANLLITIRAEDRISYSATVITLLLVGVVCFYIPGHEMSDYYQAVSVPLIFYTIIVAFLMDRIQQRDTFEEELAIGIIRHIQVEMTDVRAGVQELIGRIIAMLQTNNTRIIAGHYDYLRNDVQELKPVQDKLDALALSKVEGVNFSEILVLSMTGLLTVAMTVFFRPHNFIADCFAIVLTTAIAFVFFVVLDLVNKRAIFNLRAGEGGRITLASEALNEATGEMAIAAIMLIAVVTAFVFLMLLKHGGWYDASAHAKVLFSALP